MCGASTTAAANSNVPLSEILKVADWSSPSTFQKFSYKPIHSSNFAHAVLQCIFLYLCTYCSLSLETAHNFGFSVKQYAHIMVNYISQTPFEIYEKTNGRNFPVSASNHL